MDHGREKDHHYSEPDQPSSRLFGLLGGEEYQGKPFEVGADSHITSDVEFPGQRSQTYVS